MGTLLDRKLQRAAVALAWDLYTCGFYLTYGSQMCESFPGYAKQASSKWPKICLFELCLKQLDVSKFEFGTGGLLREQISAYVKK